MTLDVDAFLGRGPRFPLRPDPAGRLTYLTGMDLVRQSIETVLDTDPGERVMLPGFGCGLRRYLAQPNTVATRTSMQAEIRDALETWEPRIVLTNVAVTAGDDPSLVWIAISYVRRVDRRAGDLVYPFYLR